mmetsp:Transcript_21494/g.55133  ORF Transcript_21494/g.55133 Transcript_21494/m.55133 type:complete len:251 (+) Transcript_21494:38-790(+)
MDNGAWSSPTTADAPGEDAPGVAAAEEQPTSPLPRYYSPQQVQGNMNARGSMDGAAPVSSVRVEGFGGDQRSTNTLDEPVWQTIKRDLKRVFGNVKVVLLPGLEQLSSDKRALRDWDLWGPLFFTLILAICLSQGNPKAETIFSLVVLVICLGAIVLTLNVILLGGHIQFFQAVSLLGYCLFPLDVAALISIWVHNTIARGVMVLLALGWCFWAAIPFVSGSVAERRRALAVYPVLLLYTSVAWLAMTKS